MQTGTIVQISRKHIMFIVKIKGGDFSVFEIQDPIDVCIGDVICGQLDAMGCEKLLHLGQGEVFSAYGQSGPSSLPACRDVIAAF